MKKMRLSILLVSIVLAAGCAAPARYSAEEIQNYSPGVQEHIKNKEVSLGMTMTQVRYAWGGPDSIRVMEPEDGKQRIQWTYKKWIFSKTRLIFMDDKLTEIISGEPGVAK
ncbi:MAG: hypothetical protein P8Z71_00280 [Candidatus Sulfobium sp.]|jgi:hypothetical protein